MKIGWRWILLILISILPLLALTGAGLLWLWEADLLLIWIGGSGIISLLAWLISQRLQPEGLAPVKLQVDAREHWSHAGQEAWVKVEQLASQVRRREVDGYQDLWGILVEVMELVAGHFHPEQQDPMLELKAPHLLRVIELLARDLRQSLSEQVPGSHILTVNDLRRGQRWAEQGRHLYNFYRVVAFGINPISAAIREARGMAWEQILNASLGEVRGWLLDAYVKKLGFYAIELYSGHLVLDEQSLAAHTTSTSRADLAAAGGVDTTINAEPLRVLVTGQVKAGKSSLINALFGEIRALTDVLPNTRHLSPYVLERDGLEQAVILDSAGYADTSNVRAPLEEARRAIGNCDLIVLVCAANNAARAPDKALLQELNAVFTTATGEAPPPVVVALSHVDRLRPAREWQPPYNVQQPDTAKAQSIRSAMEAVAGDLNLALEQVVPVCLKEGMVDNVDEGLIPAILQRLDAARRLKYLRCLRDYRNREYWDTLWTQAQASGRFIAKSGLKWLQEQWITPRR